MDTIIREKPNVKWDDVAGLQRAKATLQEAVAIQFPHVRSLTAVSCVIMAFHHGM